MVKIQLLYLSCFEGISLENQDHNENALTEAVNKLKDAIDVMNVCIVHNQDSERSWEDRTEWHLEIVTCGSQPA